MASVLIRVQVKAKIVTLFGLGKKNNYYWENECHMIIKKNGNAASKLSLQNLFAKEHYQGKQICVTFSGAEIILCFEHILSISQQASLS